MSVRNPHVAQSDDQTIQADLTRFLSVIGPLGRLNVADLILPVVSLGDVRSTSLKPVFRSVDIFTSGVKTAAPAGTLHATTGQVAAGIYDVQLYISAHTTEAHVWEILFSESDTAEWSHIIPINGPGIQQTLSLEMMEDAAAKHITIRNTTVFGVGVQSVAAVFARLRT